jgi:hypothetical protein
VFRHLDAQEEGVLSWEQLELDAVDPNLLPLLLPLLEEMQLMRIQLTCEDFKAALNYLFGTLSPAEKHLLLCFQEEKDEGRSEERDEGRGLGLRSRQLVEESRRGQMEIYDYCQWRSARREEGLESLRVQKERG